MSLDELIAAFEAEDPAKRLPLGFNNPHSYRGYYDELAFEPAADVTVADMLAAARSALGATYQGWKGGDYTMRGYTTCWLAEEGTSGGETIGPVLLRGLFAMAQAAQLMEEREELVELAGGHRARQEEAEPDWSQAMRIRHTLYQVNAGLKANDPDLFAAGVRFVIEVACRECKTETRWTAGDVIVCPACSAHAAGRYCGDQRCGPCSFDRVAGKFGGGE